MRPMLPSNNFSDHLCAYPVFGSNHCISIFPEHVLGADGFYIAFGNFCATILAAFSTWKSPLFNRILNIVFVGPLKQMFRIATGRVVASVANKSPLRNIFQRNVSGERIRHSAGSCHLVSKPEESIPFLIPAPHPLPAISWTKPVHLRPKSISDGCIFFLPMFSDPPPHGGEPFRSAIVMSHNQSVSKPPCFRKGKCVSFF